MNKEAHKPLNQVPGGYTYHERESLEVSPSDKQTLEHELVPLQLMSASFLYLSASADILGLRRVAGRRCDKVKREVVFVFCTIGILNRRLQRL